MEKQAAWSSTARPLGRLKAYARFMAAAFLVNVKATLEYRVNFILQFFGMMLNNAAFAAFWKVLLHRVGTVGGYGFSDVMLVWALVSSSFGLAHIVFGNVRQLGRIIMEGSLDVYLLQPKDVWLNVLASKTIVSAWGDFAYGYIVLAMMTGTDLERLALFSALVLPGALIFAATFAAADSLAFFIGNASAVSSALTEFMLSFSLYPEGVYGAGLRWMLYTIVPSGFVAFMPLRIFKTLDWRFVPVLYLIAGVYVMLSYRLFNIGLKRYESGNRMDARL